jgi:hypothetical protein
MARSTRQSPNLPSCYALGVPRYHVIQQSCYVSKTPVDVLSQHRMLAVCTWWTTNNCFECCTKLKLLAPYEYFSICVDSPPSFCTIGSVPVNDHIYLQHSSLGCRLQGPCDMVQLHPLTLALAKRRCESQHAHSAKPRATYHCERTTVQSLSTLNS